MQVETRRDTVAGIAACAAGREDELPRSGGGSGRELHGERIRQDYAAESGSEVTLAERVNLLEMPLECRICELFPPLAPWLLDGDQWCYLDQHIQGSCVGGDGRRLRASRRSGVPLLPTAQLNC